MFGKVVIYGVGLMGGSLGLALRERGLAESVWGVGRDYERLKEASRRGILTHFTINRKEAAADADVVVLCLPVKMIAEEILELAPLCNEKTVMTDVGSTKAKIVAHIEASLSPEGASFVGSHPMCGSEQTGYGAATADLYNDATVAITPTGKTKAPGLARIRALWESVGGNVLILNPEEHDSLAARTSHLPRSVASALCHALEREMDAEKRDLMVSTGFLGASRTAVGDVDNWARILLSNSDHVLDALGDLQGALANLHHFLSESNEEGLRHWLAEGAEIRKRLTDSIPIARRP
jgi:prephenate dehydrogenase